MATQSSLSLSTGRPANRCFTSPVVEAEISRLKAVISDPKVRQLFENCLPNTLDTTVKTQIKDGN
ncbi:MAG TPA: hypothetical protein VK171_05695, partial [Fimbriimonas sp.]|nr:hypothetical protein [Fimbriimonas sp.]